MKPSRQVLRFGIVGLFGTALDIGIFTVLLFFSIETPWARLLGYLAGTSWSFFLNRNWVFQQTKDFSRLLPFLLTYVFSGSIAVTTQYAFSLISDSLDITYLGYTLSFLSAATLNYLLLRFFVFNPKYHVRSADK